MAHAHSFQEPSGNSQKTYLLIVISVLAFLGLAWFIYTSSNSVPGVAVEEAPPTAIDMLPPPPPPPPPPKPMEKPPEPTEKPTPTPEPTPAQNPDKAAPPKINAPPQPGPDGIPSGPDGGPGPPGGPPGNCRVPGNCGGPPKTVQGVDRFWGRNIANALEAHIEGSKKVNVDSFVGEFDVWVNGSGALTRVRLARSSGNGKLDQTVLALLQTARGLKPPPASLPMPQRIKVGRKRF